MKYIEEILPGDCFEYQNKFYILTQDFKKNGDRMCVGLADGFSYWMAQDNIVNGIDIFTIDKENNIIAVKHREKTDATSPDTNVS